MFEKYHKISPPFFCRRQSCQYLATRFVHAAFKPRPLSQIPASTPLPKLSRDDASTSNTPQATEEPLVVHAKRNHVGVQLLSRKLHSQIFRNVTFPPPNPRFITISKGHLRAHKLNPSQSSVLPDTGFTLPPLQGLDLGEHFHRIGAHAAQPWLGLARTLAGAPLPPLPECWDIQAGWTKYHFRADGSSFSEHVPYPCHRDSSSSGGREAEEEKMLVFDIECIPAHSPFAIMACAASPKAWYVWISPWLLGESDDPQHLIPLGDPKSSRVVVGHNVSFDRARTLEEYNLASTRTRFLDTMALHVAVKGICAHQRPAWMKHKKSKKLEETRRTEAIEVVEGIVEYAQDVEQQPEDVHTLEPEKREQLKRLRREMEESLPQLQSDGVDTALEENGDDTASSQRWEDIASANSLADVAKLHCGIDMSKDIRNDFMTHSPAEIRENIHDYISYCAQDVVVTHAVFAEVLPQFLVACPHPVSFAGILTMGSSFLTVDESWEHYLESAEKAYRSMEDHVKLQLQQLAESTMAMFPNCENWKKDDWLSQLDWTPKVPGKSRGVMPSEAPKKSRPAWLHRFLRVGPSSAHAHKRILPLLLKMSVRIDQMPRHLEFSDEHGWHYKRSDSKQSKPIPLPRPGGAAARGKCLNVFGKSRALPLLMEGTLESLVDQSLALSIASGDRSREIIDQIIDLANRVANETSPADREHDPWLKQLDWKPVTLKAALAPKPHPVQWPKWYWDLTKPKSGRAPGTIDITPRSRVAPLLLRLSWSDKPLFFSRKHGWAFRMPSSSPPPNSQKALKFSDRRDECMTKAARDDGYAFYKLPHKDGEKANVGNPLGKSFMPYAQNGTLKSLGNEAKEILDLNIQCGYWIGARDRIRNQTVVWQNDRLNLGFPKLGSKRYGIILPQVITMGAVTRRAIEKTWLTASNAKKNRVGSELKAMVRAPPGYAIVGADVDSEELWISSCMGDAQFGMHGATAIGWMTLEGTKAAGTDLHSKTASILGITRDQAKVFNYSRIYGAGMRHAVLLLSQSDSAMQLQQAKKLAQALYASTKGKNTQRTDYFGRKFWFGGTESYLFNQLEAVALSDQPKTPALGCAVTYALSKEYLPAEFGADYMPSRINWAVQSSGVDYLHLLIVSMDHLIEKYEIKARYIISLHDELRYLVAEEDRYRAALALQIANLWTRSFFAYKLGMDDLPQGVAFFSAVDLDHVLRKEVDMPCVTPSQPVPIPPGESLDINGVLAKTTGGSLWKDGRSMSSNEESERDWVGDLEGYVKADCTAWRAKSVNFLQAQAARDFGEVRHLASNDHPKKPADGTSSRSGEQGSGSPFDRTRNVVRNSVKL